MKGIYEKRETVRIAIDLSLDTNVYASGDVLADTQAVANVTTQPGGVVELISALIVDKDDQKQGLELVFLEANYNLGTENSGPDLTDDEAEAIEGVVSFASANYFDLGGVSVCSFGQPALGYFMKCASGSTTLYMGAISRGTGTYSATGIQVVLFFAEVT